MPSIAARLTRFARSPQGQRLVTKAREVAAKPENRQRVEQLRTKATDYAARPENRQKIMQLRERLTRKR